MYKKVIAYDLKMAMIQATKDHNKTIDNYVAIDMAMPSTVSKSCLKKYSETGETRPFDGISIISHTDNNGWMTFFNSVIDVAMTFEQPDFFFAPVAKNSGHMTLIDLVNDANYHTFDLSPKQKKQEISDIVVNLFAEESYRKPLPSFVPYKVSTFVPVAPGPVALTFKPLRDSDFDIITRIRRKTAPLVDPGHNFVAHATLGYIVGDISKPHLYHRYIDLMNKMQNVVDNAGDKSLFTFSDIKLWHFLSMDDFNPYEESHKGNVISRLLPE